MEVRQAVAYIHDARCLGHKENMPGTIFVRVARPGFEGNKFTYKMLPD